MGITELKYTNTVTINNITCCQISKTFTGVIGNPGNSVITMTNPPLYTYENNGVYYVYNSTNNVFDTLCDFKAKIGDEWGICFSPGCNTKPKLTVVDTGHVFINNQFLKRIIVNYGFTNYDTIIEKICGVNNYFGTFYICFGDLPRMPNFICYQDNNFPLYMKSTVTTCLYDVGLAEEDKTINLKLYPNPSNGNIKFETKDNNVNVIKLTIFNALGQNIFEESDYPLGKEISTKLFPRGLYYIKVELENQNQTFKIIVE